MKKYLLFAGDNYYPRAGTSDYEGDFDTIEEAVAKGTSVHVNEHWKTGQRVYDWYEVVEHATMQRVVYQ